MSLPPLILCDNWFDTTVLHPSFLLSNPDADDLAGQEAFRVADNLRDMSEWSPAATNAIRKLRIVRDSTATPNILVLDRGTQNVLGGKTFRLQSSTDAFTTVTTDEVVVTMPTTVGGLPSDANGCLTKDGVWWKTFTISNNRAGWQLSVDAMGAGLAPLVTGAYLGVAYRFPTNAFLDANAAPDYARNITYTKNAMTRGGVRVKMKPRSHRSLVMNLPLEATDYAAFEAMITNQLEYNHPLWFCLDESDATQAGLTGLWQLPGDTFYDPQSSPLHREIKLTFEEVIPTMRL
jgi:hypothetical protein